MSRETRDVLLRQPSGKRLGSSTFDASPGTDWLSAEQIASLSKKRFRVSLAYTFALIVIHIGFILMVAYRKIFLSLVLVDGLTVAVLMAALVVIAALTLTFAYSSWIAGFEQDVRMLADARVSPK